MSITCRLHVGSRCRSLAVWPAVSICAVWAVFAGCLSAAESDRSPTFGARLGRPIVLSQLPAGTELEKGGPVAGGMLRAPYGEGARLVVVLPNSTARVLSGQFHSAADPAVSFDGKRILFAGKRTASEDWNIYEMATDGSGVRQITRDLGDCRSPGYQSMLYTIASAEPWYQITFVSTAGGTLNEYGPVPATNLYSCKLDGSAVRRLTFNLSSDMDPVVMSDGRMLLSSWQRRTLGRGPLGRIALFGINIDGSDYAAFSTDGGQRIKHMPCVASGGLAVFVEADAVPWDGAGRLACVQLRRPLHSYRPITDEADGLFHSPSPLPDGTILVSRRPGDGSRTHGVFRLDPATKKAELVFDDVRYHEIQARLIRPRDLPDGRSSVVSEQDPHGKLYCLNVYTSDLRNRSWMPPGTVKMVRVLEGVPLRIGQQRAYLPASEAGGPFLPGSSRNGIPPLVQRRILGEVPVHEDGSFNLEVPANTPIELQILDADGLALRSCGWIWAKNHEPRGCIGCHEDGELTPENWFVDAMEGPSTAICPPPDKRNTVDFRRDVMPIVTAKCAPCHREGKTMPRLDGGLTAVEHQGGKSYFNRAYENLLGPRPASDGNGSYSQYVQPGKARTSPLIWHVSGRNTSRPWDSTGQQPPVKPMPPQEAKPLTPEEKRTLVRWIDLGALWNGIPGTDNRAHRTRNLGGEPK